MASRFQPRGRAHWRGRTGLTSEVVVDRSRVLEQVPGQDADDVFVASPAVGNQLSQSRDGGSDAGSQPMPSLPMTAFARQSRLQTVSTSPPHTSSTRIAFGHDTGAPILIAVARVVAFATRSASWRPIAPSGQTAPRLRLNDGDCAGGR
jgi:hypothetical protein